MNIISTRGIIYSILSLPEAIDIIILILLIVWKNEILAVCKIFKIVQINTTSSCARSARFATCVRSSLHSPCRRALE